MLSSKRIQSTENMTLKQEQEFQEAFAKELVRIGRIFGSQKDCASIIGISKSHLCEIEKGKKMPSLMVLKKIINAYELGPDHLVELLSITEWSVN